MAKIGIILSERFQPIGEVGLDERNRISVAKAIESLKKLLGEAEGLRFFVYVNDAGQLLLSPTISVPLHELWLYKNPVAFASVTEGLAQVGKREQLKDMGSFEKYADDEID